MRNKDLEELSQIEERLDDCLSSLAHYTGRDCLNTRGHAKNINDANNFQSHPAAVVHIVPALPILRLSVFLIIQDSPSYSTTRKTNSFTTRHFF